MLGGRGVIIFFFMLSLFTNNYAQDIPRDTSYTIHSAYEKYVKSHPYISPVIPDTSELHAVHRDVTYRKIASRKLMADIFIPNRARKSGYAVLLIHGGGWVSGNKSLLHHVAAALARNGYTSMAIEYRLSLEAPYPAALQDVRAAVAWLRNQADELQIDPDNIIIVGSSAGGQLAALAGATIPLQFGEEADLEIGRDYAGIRAVVNIDGVLAFIHPESEESRVAGKWLGDDRETWIEASALSHIGERTPPMLFIGSSNPRFLAGRADVINILERYVIHHDTKIFHDAPHSFWLFDPWFDPMMEVILGFLNSLSES